jgi:hypothetical protein
MRIGNLGWLVLAAVDAMAGERVPIHLVGIHQADYLRLLMAKQIASRMLAAAGVDVVWNTGVPRGDSQCCQAPVVLRLQTGTPANERPGAFAFAFPYANGDGAITIFYDRISKGWRRFEHILAHVMVHEVVHILQGLVRHSDTGMMKAFWNGDDYRRMQHDPLPFTAADVELIQLGLRKRTTGRATIIR